MEGPRLFGVDNMALVQEVVVPQLKCKVRRHRNASQPLNIVDYDRCMVVAHLVTEEATTDIDLLASNDDDLLPRECLFGNSRRQAAEEVSFPVNNNWRRRERGHFRLDKHSRCQ